MVRRSLSLIAVTVMFAGCAKAPPKADHGMTDRELARALVGTWRMEAAVFGIPIHSVSTYREDGTASGEVVVGDEPPAKLEWTWKVVDGVTRTTVTKTSLPDLMAVGDTGTDRILRLSETEYVYVDDEGQEVTERRLR